MDTGGNSECGWTKAYHPSGLLVRLPLTGQPTDYVGMLANVTAALAAGFLAVAPGAGEGEHKDEVGYVVKREKENQDHTVTPVIDLYVADDAMKFATLSVYLNTAEQVAAFEFASGVKVSALPLYIGDNKIERGGKAATDKLIIKSPRPFGVFWRDNPKYDPAEMDATKKKPKRLFSRWADQRPQAVAAVGGNGLPLRTGEPGEAYRSALADLKECSTISALQYVWGEIQEAKSQFATPELNDLVATKESRKRELMAAGGRLFAAGEPAGGGMPVHH